ncbi:MAG: hypothetical protein ACFFFB_04900 [Candidatus Heimdallarchaeota archaeon]
MEEKSTKKKVLSKRGIIIRFIFIAFYLISLYFLYIFLVDLAIEHWIIIIILIFLILIVIGPLLTGISKSMYRRLFPKRERREKSDYELYKEDLKSQSQTYEFKPVDTKDINLNFKYRKPIIRKCPNCKITIPNFVKTCPNCGVPVMG